MVIPGQQLKLD